jgi:hypothetical protein
VVSRIHPFIVLGFLAIFATGCGGTSVSQQARDALYNSNQIENPLAPVVTLNGPSTMALPLGVSYEEFGATAYSIEEGDLTSLIVIKNEIDPQTVGQYAVIYRVTDSQGRQGQAVRQVSIIEGPDVTPPVLTVDPAVVHISLCELSTSYLTEGTVQAIDNVDGNLTSQIQMTDHVIPLTTNSYQVDYQVEDSSHNLATAHRTVIVDGLINGTNFDRGIQTLADFTSMEAAPTDNYFLCSDLQLNENFSPLFLQSSFEGIFDGGGHSIVGGSIHEPSLDNVGVFSKNSGMIQNVLVKDLIVEGQNYVGSLVGTNTGVIDSVGVLGTGTLTGRDRVGGMVGSNGSASEGGIIRKSFARIAVSGNTYVGGLVGHNIQSNSATTLIEDSYATGEVVGINSHYDEIGGLSGRNSGSIVHSYALARNLIQNSQATHLGGIVGRSVSTGTVIESFWNVTTSSFPVDPQQPESEYGTGKTDTEMQNLATFTDANWDFSNPSGVWKFIAELYPVHQWWNP